MILRDRIACRCSFPVMSFVGYALILSFFAVCPLALAIGMMLHIYLIVSRRVS